MLRVICQRTGETIRCLLVDADRPAEAASRSRQQIEKKPVRRIDPDAQVDSIPRRLRPDYQPVGWYEEDCDHAWRKLHPGLEVSPEKLVKRASCR